MLVGGTSTKRSRDALETEAALLRVLGKERRVAPAARTEAEPGNTELREAEMPAIIRDLHSRIAAVEEELAQARFELRQMSERQRDRPGLASRDADSGAAALRAPGGGGDADAEAILARAVLDAQRIRDEAAADAHRTRERARLDAIALTHDAFVAVEALRRLSAELASPLDPPGDADS